MSACFLAFFLTPLMLTHIPLTLTLLSDSLLVSKGLRIFAHRSTDPSSLYPPTSPDVTIFRPNQPLNLPEAQYDLKSQMASLQSILITPTDSSLTPRVHTAARCALR